MSNVLAFDLGAGSGRAILGRLTGRKMVIEELHRFSNDPVLVHGRLHWDILRLYHEVKSGLLKMKIRKEEIDSLGIDSWAVDFGFIGANGELLAFYHTDLADWGMALQLANKLGKQAEVLVDLGHHAPGTNVEHIVSYLIDEQRLGGFHFNSRKYADDDLIVGTINPYELFLIFHQIVNASTDPNPNVRSTVEGIAYMIDQSHNIESKIEAMIRSVGNVQTQYAKALLVDTKELKQAQQNGDVLGAEFAIRRAFEYDVTPLLRAVREECGLPVDPVTAYRSSTYAKNVNRRGC